MDSVTLDVRCQRRAKTKPVSGEQDVPLRDSLGVRVLLRFVPRFRARLARENVDDTSPWSLGVARDARRTHSLAEVHRGRRVGAAAERTRADARRPPPNIACCARRGNVVSNPSLTLDNGLATTSPRTKTN